jgi:hypothetical protein
MSVRITCTWNPESLERGDESLVTFGKGFEDLHRIEKLDFLRDCLFHLGNAYAAELGMQEKAFKVSRGEKVQ